MGDPAEKLAIVAFTPAVEDLVEATLAERERSGAVERAVERMRFGMGALLSFLLILHVIAHGLRSLPFSIAKDPLLTAAGLFAPALFVGARRFHMNRLRYSARRVFTRKDKAGDLKPARVSLTPTGAVLEKGMSVAYADWRDVLAVESDDLRLWIYVRSDRAWVVPARAFDDPRDFRDFAAAARRLLDDARAGRVPIPAPDDAQEQVPETTQAATA